MLCKEKVLKLALEGKTLRKRPRYVTKQYRNYKKLWGKSDWFTTNPLDRDGSEIIPEIVESGQQLNDFQKRKSPTQKL